MESVLKGMVNITAAGDVVKDRGCRYSLVYTERFELELHFWFFPTPSLNPPQRGR